MLCTSLYVAVYVCSTLHWRVWRLPAWYVSFRTKQLLAGKWKIHTVTCQSRDSDISLQVSVTSSLSFPRSLELQTTSASPEGEWTGSRQGCNWNDANISNTSTSSPDVNDPAVWAYGGLKINEDVTWVCVKERRGCENSCEFCEDDQHLTDQQTTSLANRKEKKRIVFPVDLIPSQAWRWAQGCKICRMNYLRLARGKHVTYDQ